MRNIKEYVKQEQFRIVLKNQLINIEYFSDLGNISDNEIVIYNRNQKIIIKGKKMSINKLLKDEILIKGTYNNIFFEGSNE